MILTPIALFVYNRLWHLQKTIEFLKKNKNSTKSDLFIFSDGPKNVEAEKSVTEIREYIKTISGFKTINIIEKQENYGLAKSIITGVTEIVNKYGKVIVVEDDLVSSPYFLKFMNDGLNFYKDVDSVISIHGYIYPIKEQLPNTFFLRGADCWGWATWKRGWDLFEADGKKLLTQLKMKKLDKIFDQSGPYSLIKMLEEQIEGKNDSWAIRWHASAFLEDRLTLYPGKSLINNIGYDSSGTHCNVTNTFDVNISMESVEIKDIPIEENIYTKKILQNYFNSIKPGLVRRILNKIKKLLVIKI